MLQAQPTGRLVRDASIDPATNPFAETPKGRRGSGGVGGEFEDALALNVGVDSDRSAHNYP